MILISMSEGMTMMKLEMTEEKTMIFIDSLECILEFNRLNFLQTRVRVYVKREEAIKRIFYHITSAK